MWIISKPAGMQSPATKQACWSIDPYQSWKIEPASWRSEKSGTDVDLSHPPPLFQRCPWADSAQHPRWKTSLRWRIVPSRQWYGGLEGLARNSWAECRDSSLGWRLLLVFTTKIHTLECSMIHRSQSAYLLDLKPMSEPWNCNVWTSKKRGKLRKWPS